MADVLALEKLYADVTARFAAEGLAAVNLFGWRQPSLVQTYAAGRVTWVPGDQSGAAGSVEPPRNPGRTPRSLATLRELFTVTITASDPTKPDDEAAQYRMVRLLRDYWHRAVYLSAHGTFKINSERWVIDRKERRFGAALRIVCSVDAMVPDSPPTPDVTSLFASGEISAGLGGGDEPAAEPTSDAPVVTNEEQ
jgi:hypothetical protein